MNPKTFVFLFSFLIIVLIVTDVQQIFVNKDQKMLTAAKIKTSIETKYPGTIKDIKLSETDGNQIYIVDLQDQHRAYALKVDAYSGTILHLTQVKKDTSKHSVNIENGVSAALASGEEKDEELANNATPQVAISLDNAKEIALSKVKGTFNSIDLEDKNGSFIYEIEVETNKKEAVDVDINAYTGEVLSISWDN